MILTPAHAPVGHPAHATMPTRPDNAPTENADAGVPGELSAADQQRVRELQARDREVRAHEQAHLSAAGSLARGTASYTYERGPDNRQYAVGGEVQIDTSAVAGDPVATLRKAQTIRRAALAPANPSAQDRAVAAEASRMAAQASAEIAAQRTDETSATESDKELAPTKGGCPACGGAHSAAAHDGMHAYTATGLEAAAPAPSIRTVV